jgi:hypothetical protein
MYRSISGRCCVTQLILKRSAGGAKECSTYNVLRGMGSRTKCLIPSSRSHGADPSPLYFEVQDSSEAEIDRRNDPGDRQRRAFANGPD